MVEGRIGFKPRGAGGFGYDPLFIPDGHTRTFGEMEAAEKKLISHRGRALHKMRGYLESQISNLKSQSAERIEEQIAVAAAAIGRGEVVVYPTETVYGLGADPFSEPALRRLYAIKERDAANPVLLVVDGLDQLRAVVREVSAAAEAYARRFWPGPLSMLFPKSPRLPKILTGGLEHVCVRWTSHPLARALCREAGHAITSTSANLAGQPPAQSLAEVRLDGLGAKVDGGLLPPSLPSTVFDPSTGRILREGAIPAEVLLGMGRDGVYT
jgi:L-threonylcarbamoyladenylate synthase